MAIIFHVGERVRWREEFSDVEVRIREALYDPLDEDRQEEVPGHRYEVVDVDGEGWVLLRDVDDIEHGEAGSGRGSMPGLSPTYFKLIGNCESHVNNWVRPKGGEPDPEVCARCDAPIGL